MPPPPPPAPLPLGLFQADGAPEGGRFVPPTPVTNGWLEGSLTESGCAGLAFGPPLPHPSEPVSPLAARIVWPCVAASWKSVLSAAAKLEPLSRNSQVPHESAITFSLLALMIAFQ